MYYFQPFAITGEANKVLFAKGLSSTTENPKRLLSILVQVSGYTENEIQGYLEREKVFGIPDSLIDTVEEGATDKIGKSFNRMNEIEVGLDLPIGATFEAALQCFANPKDLKGAYRYEIIS